jgi:hypothetical protein
MRIHFDRTGGFAGMRVQATIDTDSLTPDDARQITELVAAAQFFELPSVIAATAPGADQFQYRLTVETEGRKHTVEVGDASAPETVQPLLRKLVVLARRSPSN